MPPSLTASRIVSGSLSGREVVGPVEPVGGARAPSKERWETRSVFHGSGRIHGPPVGAKRRSSRLCLAVTPRLGSDFAHRAALEFDPVRAVDEPVADRIGDRRFAERVVPRFDGELTRDQGRGAFVAIFDDFEDVPAFGVFEGGVARQNSIRVDTGRFAHGESYSESWPVASLTAPRQPFILSRCSPESPSSWVGSGVSERRGPTF